MVQHSPETPNNTDLLIEIRDLLIENNKPKDALWTVRDIAAYCGYSYNITRRTIIKAKGFPRPRIMPTGATEKGAQRWVPEEIRQYFKARNRG